MEQQLQFEEAKKKLSWREIRLGVYKFHNIEHRGTDSYGKQISVITLETKGAKMMYYSPPSLYWELNRRSETNFIKYEGTQTSEKGYEYPVFKFTKRVQNIFENSWICQKKWRKLNNFLVNSKKKNE